MLVLGTSLQVAPFCSIPNLVNRECTRVLVDINPKNAYINTWTTIQREPFGMYSAAKPKTFITVGKGLEKRNVTLTSKWGKRTKWKDQYIVESTCDTFAKNIMS